MLPIFLSFVAILLPSAAFGRCRLAGSVDSSEGGRWERRNRRPSMCGWLTEREACSSRSALRGGMDDLTVLQFVRVGIDA